jgi:hypothetical protein
MIQEGSRLWQYLSESQRVLAGDGAFLLADSARHINEEPTDYSYIVFPFAKLYEGFLKQLFLDLSFIDQHEYASEHYRIGKALSPNLVRLLGRRSVYRQIELRFGKDLATRLWHAWKNGRNLVFHYFPHNYRSLSLEQAKNQIRLLVETMEQSIEQTDVHPKNRESD